MLGRGIYFVDADEVFTMKEGVKKIKTKIGRTYLHGS